MINKMYACECGAVTGHQCGWAGPKAQTAIVEWMPVCWRASHVADGGAGQYPHDGSQRLRVSQPCADKILADNDGWASVIEPAQEPSRECCICAMFGIRTGASTEIARDADRDGPGDSRAWACDVCIAAGAQ